jgi:hypothetical protein
VWLVPLAQLFPHPQLIFFPSKTWFFWNLFEFSAAEITLKSISLAHSKSSEIFSYDFILFYFILFLVKKFIQYSRTLAPSQVQTSWNQKPMAPILNESFPKTPKNTI